MEYGGGASLFNAGVAIVVHLVRNLRTMAFLSSSTGMLYFVRDSGLGRLNGKELAFPLGAT